MPPAVRVFGAAFARPTPRTTTQTLTRASRPIAMSGLNYPGPTFRGSRPPKFSGLGSNRAAGSRSVTMMGLFGLGLPELVVIGGVAAVLFGPSKLPELGKSLGKTVKSFQAAANVCICSLLDRLSKICLYSYSLLSAHTLTTPSFHRSFKMNSRTKVPKQRPRASKTVTTRKRLKKGEGKVVYDSYDAIIHAQLENASDKKTKVVNLKSNFPCSHVYVLLFWPSALQLHAVSNHAAS